MPVPPKIYEAFGEFKSVDEWVGDPRCQVPRWTIFDRLRRGIPFLEALTTPPGQVTRLGRVATRQLTAFGETKSVAEWAADPRCECGKTALEERIRRGQSLADALKGARVMVRPGKLHLAFGEAKTVAQWVLDARCMCRPDVLRARLRAGEALEDAIKRPSDMSSIAGFGETKSIADWARDPRCDQLEATVRSRLLAGYSLEDAIKRDQVRPHGKQYSAFGELKTLDQWAKDNRCQVSGSELTRRIRNGMEIETALTFRMLSLVHAFGEAKTIAEWARDPRATVVDQTIRNRIFAGYPPEMAITDPPNFKTKRFWDLEKRGIEIPAESRGVARLPIADVTEPALKQSHDMDRMQRRFLAALRKSGAAKPKEQHYSDGTPAGLYFAYGEGKSLGDWAADDRCPLTLEELQAAVERGESVEDAIVSARIHRYTQKPD